MLFLLHRFIENSSFTKRVRFKLFQGGCVPTDDITIYYKTSKNLCGIMKDFKEFIDSTVKKPLLPYPVPAGTEVIVSETANVRNVYYLKDNCNRLWFS